MAPAKGLLCSRLREARPVSTLLPSSIRNSGLDRTSRHQQREPTDRATRRSLGKCRKHLTTQEHAKPFKEADLPSVSRRLSRCWSNAARNYFSGAYPGGCWLRKAVPKSSSFSWERLWEPLGQNGGGPGAPHIFSQRLPQLRCHQSQICFNSEAIPKICFCLKRYIIWSNTSFPPTPPSRKLRFNI